jgi:ABC-2 type transport system ATP-binding protein
MATAIRADALTKDFSTGFWRRRATRALDGLSLEVPLGGVFGLLGPNGAGKSTTLKILMHLLWPTSGRAEVLGRPPGDVDARRRLGFLPEHPTFYDHLTAEEVLTYFAGLFGYAGSDRARRVRGALDLVGLGDARSRPMRGYSKGMLQRVGLAQALVNDPELVVLDEPMSGLDPLGRREVREIILSLRDAGRTVVFSSHILSDAEMLCSRVAIVTRGRVVASGSLTELTSGEARGAEIVVTGLGREAAERLRPRVARVTEIDEGRFSIEAPVSVRPEALVAELAAAGASLVSVTPLRVTLEDVFLARVAAGRDESSAAPEEAVS